MDHSASQSPIPRVTLHAPKLTAGFGNTCTHWREQCCVLVSSRRDTQEVGYSEQDPQKFAKKGSWAEKGKNLTKFNEDLMGEVWLKTQNEDGRWVRLCYVS